VRGWCHLPSPSNNSLSLLPASFLESRSWRGLEQQLGQTPISKAVQGRRGIAIAYEDEGREQP